MNYWSYLRCSDCWWHAVWIYVWGWYNWHYFLFKTFSKNTSERIVIFTLHLLTWKRFWQGAQKGPMVGLKKSRHTRVNCACNFDIVSKYKKSFEDKQFVQWCVQGSSRFPSRLSTKPPTIHYRLGSIISRIPNWLPMGTFVCWWPSNDSWHYGWTTLQTGLMGKTCGSQRPYSEHGKDQDYDL